MTHHPAKEAGCTKRQIEVFERIALGVSDQQSLKCTLKTIEGLAKKNLITIGKRVLISDRFGVVTVPDCSVPIPVHMQWCKWASENCEIPED